MALARTYFRFSTSTYRHSKISDRFQLLITKKEVECDYVALDATGLVATGLRLAKNVTTDQRRHKEVARHVAQSVQQILKKIRCKKSLLIAMDGAETLLKAERTRASSVTRKVESRLMRLPGTPLMQAVEERIVRMMPERQILPSEVVFSGTCVQGCVEQKMSAWALDLACRDTFNGSTDLLCLIGATELYLNVMALSPYYNVMSVVQNNADLRQMRLQDVLEYLELDKKAREGDSVTIAKMRTDILFLFILAHGASATELMPITGIGFHDLVERYTKSVLDTAVDDSSTAVFLFEDCPGNTLRLNVALLARIMELVARREAPPKQDATAEAYIEHALQTHAMLCLGETPDADYLPTASHNINSSAINLSVPSIAQLAGHLNALRSASPYRTARRSATGPALLMNDETKESNLPTSSNPRKVQTLTAAEYTLLCHAQPAAVEGLVQQFVGVAPKPEVGKMITSADTRGAHSLIRNILSYANPLKPHKCLCRAPSYCWLQNEKTQLWRFEYVDIGVRSHTNEIRRHRNAVKGLTLEVNMSRDGPASFVPSSESWEPIEAFPCGGVGAKESSTQSESQKMSSSFSEASSSQLPDDALGRKSPGSTLKLLTWNVMFDRYSGKPTPLGMPGIDWCSPKRYPVLARLMDREDADVVGMQEVEPAFWSFLAQQPWVRERYYFSCGLASPAINPWGILMLVHRRRCAVQGMTYLNVPAWTNHISLMPVVALKMGHGTVHVAAAHLLAPYTKSHETARTSQDNALRHHMTKTLSGDTITMGDFNDWPTNEFIMPTESQYVDCWPLLHPKDAGKTMDESNTFCKLKVEEMFFGRSDKIFLRSSRLVPVEAHLVGTKSVNAENGNGDAPAYLFPSDHYGVSMTFALRNR